MHVGIVVAAHRLGGNSLTRLLPSSRFMSTRRLLLLLLLRPFTSVVARMNRLLQRQLRLELRAGDLHCEGANLLLLQCNLLLQDPFLALALALALALVLRLYLSSLTTRSQSMRHITNNRIST